MFDDHPRRKQAFSYTIQILILHSGHIEIFSKGLTRDFPLCLFLNKMGLEIMFADHPVRKQAFLD